MRFLPNVEGGFKKRGADYKPVPALSKESSSQPQISNPHKKKYTE
jgi:hypothetical protein